MVPTMNHLGQRIGFPLPDWEPPPVPPPTPMEGRYCRLEPVDPDRHARGLFEADSADADGRSWTYLAYGPFSDLSIYRAWLEGNCLGDDPFFFAVIDTADGAPVGLVSYLRIAPASGSIEVGHIHYSPRLQRTPAATEAMYLMMKNAFDLGYRRYEWKCDQLNAASRAAAQRLGLSFEGVFRQATVYKGRNRDTAWYAAIDAEWPALREAFLAWLDPNNFDENGHQRMGNLGTCFDVSLLKEGQTDRMWFSWRPKKAVALTEAADGVHWGPPVIALGPNQETDWEEDINRPVVVKRPDGYHMWYTGQARGHSWIGHATSPDGTTWTRNATRPVLSPEAPWEKVAVMCPHVLWDEEAKQYRMWYSGGDQYEPDAIGYATSADGLSWTKHAGNPIFRADPGGPGRSTR
jgi:RimJ/RimL family protein N-acetyltransferase